jgi:hypothetical protein
MGQASVRPGIRRIDGVTASTLERNPVAVGSAEDILDRLERYAAARRVASAGPTVIDSPLTITPSPRRVTVRRADVHPLRIGPALLDAATVDLFPYDLVATILGCVATILASIAFTRPLALLIAAGLALTGEWARRSRWFPSVGTNLLLGTAIGVVLVLVS